MTPGNDLRVTPAITQLAIQPSQKTVDLAYTLTNQTNQPLSIALSARDFGALSQNGSISFYSGSYNSSSNPHGIQAYVSFPSPNITIAPHASEQVSANIQNVSKLAPGGHYGAILFSPQGVFTNSNKDRVNLETSVAGIVFVTTASGGTMGVKATASHLGSVRFSLPSSQYVVFSDTGNTQTVPQGQLTLYGLSGQVLGTADINTASGLVLPGSSRIFTVTFPASKKWFALPGVYHMKLMYKDSTDASFKTINQSFIYINWLVTALCAVAIIIIVIVVRRLIIPLLKKLYSYVKKKRTPPAPPEKPKRPPRLIQG